MIGVLIKASSPVVKAGLESLVRATRSLYVVNDSGPPKPTASGVANWQAEVVLAELESRDDKLVQEVLDQAADGAPVILLVHGSTTLWADELRRGVRAILPNTVTGPEVAAAIEAAAAGLVVLHPSEIERFLPSQSIHESRAETLLEPLTPRESEVLRLLAEGLANKEIASRLGVSEHTVKFHVASILGKLGAASRTEAVMLGIRRGIVLI